MHIYEKEFDFVIQRAMSLKRPARMVVAGADLENILQAVFEAEKKGFCQPILVGHEGRIRALLEQKDADTLRQLVPPTTFAYLEEHFLNK